MEIFPWHLECPQLEFGLYTFFWYNFSVLIAFIRWLSLLTEPAKLVLIASLRCRLVWIFQRISGRVYAFIKSFISGMSKRIIWNGHSLIQFDQCIYHKRFSPILRFFYILLTIFLGTFHNILKYSCIWYDSILKHIQNVRYLVSDSWSILWHNTYS